MDDLPPPLPDEPVAAALAVAEAAAAAAGEEDPTTTTAASAAAAAEDEEPTESGPEQLTPAKRKPGRPPGSKDSKPRKRRPPVRPGEFEVTFREPTLGILLSFDSSNLTPDKGGLKITVKEVMSQHADSLGILPGDEIVAVAGTEIADVVSTEQAATLIQQTSRPTVVKLHRATIADGEDDFASVAETPLSAAAYAARAKAVIEVQEAEDEVTAIKEQLARAVAKQITAKRKMDATASWMSSPWWTTKDDNWTKRYAELVEYRNTHGTVDLSVEDGELGKWCKNQRKYYNQPAERATTITPAVAEGRLNLLDEIGFDLTYKEQSKIFQGAWDAKYEELVQYRNEHGHCNVPNTPGEHRQLGRWVMKQRGMYQAMLDGDRAKQKGLTQERVDRLNALDFSWRRGNNPRKGTKVSEWKGGGGALARKSGGGGKKDDDNDKEEEGGGGGGEGEGGGQDYNEMESVGV